MRIRGLGDRALLLEFGTQPDEHTRHAVHSAYARLESSRPDGVFDIVPGFTTLAVHYDPARIARGEHGSPMAAMVATIERLLTASDASRLKPGHLVELPVCYHPSCGPDLEEVARHAGITEDDVIALHTSSDYAVQMIGFLPGFPYLAGMDERLTTPRRSSPRLKVAAGSVGIGGTQTGVYPIESPGGWQLIGRTPARLFTVERDPPALLQIGDVVRFRPVSLAEFSAHQS